MKFQRFNGLEYPTEKFQAAIVLSAGCAGARHVVGILCKRAVVPLTTLLTANACARLSIKVTKR
jgi:hypothetical protein